MKKVILTKRQTRNLFRKIISDAQKMCNLPYEDKLYKEGDSRRYRMFIEDEALEHIMKHHTDKLFD